jgi:hypothetical protein
VAVCIPPIAECAMDRAPGNGKGDRRSFDCVVHKVP